VSHEQSKKMMPVRKKLRIFAGAKLVTRAHKPDVNGGNDPAWFGSKRDHAIAKIDRLLKIMGYENDRGFPLGRQPRDLVLQGLSGQRVERAKGLVHEKNSRLLRETARNLHPLLHAT
jgi:hypothetical protein